MYYINNIKNIKLNKNIEVSIEKYNNEYIVSIDNLSLYSYGNNLNVVIDELIEDLEKLYDILFNSEYHLSKSALKMKKIIELNLINSEKS